MTYRNNSATACWSARQYLPACIGSERFGWPLVPAVAQRAIRPILANAAHRNQRQRSWLPGGIAPFLLPVLRYYIGESNGPVPRTKLVPEAISLVAPQSGVRLDKDAALTFKWLENENVSLCRLEIEANGKQAYAARVRPSAQSGINRYTAPPFTAASLVDKVVRWRVVALASAGQFVGESEWREIASVP